MQNLCIILEIASHFDRKKINKNIHTKISQNPGGTDIMKEL